VLADDRLHAPRLDLRVDFLVQFADRRGTHFRAPQRFRYVFDSPYAHARKIHLDERLFNARFAPPVALDDLRLKGERAQLRHLERHFARFRVELALVVPRAGVGPLGASFVAACLAERVRFGVQERIKRLFNALRHSGIQMRCNCASSNWMILPCWEALASLAAAVVAAAQAYVAASIAAGFVVRMSFSHSLIFVGPFGLPA
jgi:hypothetical protein